KAEMHMGAIAYSIRRRLRREAGAKPKPARRLADYLAGDDGAVAGHGAHRRGAGNLELAAAVFRFHCLDADIRLLQGSGDVPHERGRYPHGLEGERRQRAETGPREQEFMLEGGGEAEPGFALEIGERGQHEAAGAAFPVAAVRDLRIAEKDVIGRRVLPDVD